MLESVDSSARQFLLANERLSGRLERAQRQVSSGKRIETASDAPDQIGELLQVRSAIAENRQLRDNLAAYKLEEDVAANALEQASAALDSVKSLTSIGMNGSLSPAMQANLLQQLQSFMQEMVGIAATQVNGRFVFSGDSDMAPPFTLDLSLPNGISAYAGAASTRRVQHPDGSSFAIAHTAAEIFDSPNPGEGVFAALAVLRQALIDNSSAEMQSALAGLQAAQDHLHTQAAFYGMAQKRISQATDAAANKDTQLQTHLSSIEDADVTAAILELQDAQFQRQAALSSRAQIPPTSLFDYLK
jgi:flagellar hook-associated protein 3 FlgL